MLPTWSCLECKHGLRQSEFLLASWRAPVCAWLRQTCWERNCMRPDEMVAYLPHEHTSKGSILIQASWVLQDSCWREGSIWIFIWVVNKSTFCWRDQRRWGSIQQASSAGGHSRHTLVQNDGSSSRCLCSQMLHLKSPRSNEPWWFCQKNKQFLLFTCNMTF